MVKHLEPEPIACILIDKSVWIRGYLYGAVIYLYETVVTCTDLWPICMDLWLICVEV